MCSHRVKVGIVLEGRNAVETRVESAIPMKTHLKEVAFLRLELLKNCPHNVGESDL